MKHLNRQLRQKVKAGPCIVCGAYGCDPDHILNSRGLKSREKEFNLWPLCRKHHTEKTTTGLTRFSAKYSLEKELISRGFQLNNYNSRWFHPDL